MRALGGPPSLFQIRACSASCGTAIEVAMLIPLKEKYLVQRNYKGGAYRPRAGNSNGKTKHSIWWYLEQSSKGRRASRGTQAA